MTTAFTVTRDDVINSALRLQGWLDYTQTAPAQVVTNMAQALQIMIKAWASKGLKVWTIETLTLPLVAGQSKYTIGPTGADLAANRPLRIEQAYVRLNPTSTAPQDTSLIMVSKNEYNKLGNKSAQGVPNQYFYDPQLGTALATPRGDLYLYLTPDSTIAASYNVKLFSRRQIMDISSASANFDFPQEWFQALRWGLAKETSLENQIPEGVADRISTQATQYLKEMEDWDREYASIYFQPNTEGG